MKPDDAKPAIDGQADFTLDELMSKLRALDGQGQWGALRDLVGEAEALRPHVRDLGYLRARAFSGLGDEEAAREALNDELRRFPGNLRARRFLEGLPNPVLPSLEGIRPELARILPAIFPRTIVQLPRLINLFELARQICLADVPGDFAACGLADRGVCALLAWAIRQYSHRPRLLHSFDLFACLPGPEEGVGRQGRRAKEGVLNATTCAAPEEGLPSLYRELGVEDLVRPARGLFAETPPRRAKAIKRLAMLHLDGDWHASISLALTHLSGLVGLGGAFQVDDYGSREGCGKALADFFAARGERAALLPIAEGSGVWFIKPPVHPLKRKRQRPAVLVNLGCGDKHDPAWINFDKKTSHPNVIRHDAMSALPLPQDCADAVYNSHMLEHLPKELAPRLLEECFRVLRPGGVLRLVVPNLEAVARLYLKCLDGALTKDPVAIARYPWSVIELIDQLCRHVSGGEMLRYWLQTPLPAEDFVMERAGSEAKGAIARLRANPGLPPAFDLDPVRVGQYRLSGECHLWMYDRHSLDELLRGAGFTGIRICRADKSAIPDFNSYLLDIEPGCAVRKPDSLFMEAVKPIDVGE